MVKLTTPKQASFQMLCRMVSSIIPSATLQFREKNLISLSAIDLSNVALVSAQLHLQHNIEDVDFSVDIKDIDGSGVLSIEDDNYLVIKDNNITYRYERLVESFTKEMPKDKFTWEVSFNLIEDFSPILKSMDKKKDESLSFAIDINDQCLSFYDSPKKTVTITNDNITNSTPMKSLFSVDYIKLISSNFKYFDNVTVYMGEDYPIKFVCSMEGLEVVYILAPRII